MRRHRDDLALGVVLLVLGAFAALSGCPKPPAQPPPGAPAVMAPTPGTAAPSEGDEVDVDFTLTSAAFAHQTRIPEKYTGDGEDVSPPLSWTAPPEGTKELVLICDDPDAPVGTWNHWVLYGLSPEATSLPEGIPTQGTVDEPALMQGLNTWPKVGYGGPAPPRGRPHRYQFTLYAVGKELGLEPEATKDKVLAAMKDSVLAKTTLEGVYSR